MKKSMFLAQFFNFNCKSREKKALFRAKRKNKKEAPKKADLQPLGQPP